SLLMIERVFVAQTVAAVQVADVCQLDAQARQAQSSLGCARWLHELLLQRRAEQIGGTAGTFEKIASGLQFVTANLFRQAAQQTEAAMGIRVAAAAPEAHLNQSSERIRRPHAAQPAARLTRQRGKQQNRRLHRRRGLSREEILRREPVLV